MSKHAWKLDLIPWDHKSTDHVTRLHEQRIACGWAADKVPSFVQSATRGEKVFYWIVFADAFPERETLLANHIAKYPKEEPTLTDSANEVCLVYRIPSERPFTPIGHIAIGIRPPQGDEKLDLPQSGVAWIHQLYISYALQRGGFGGAAMWKAEQVAASEPFNASIVAIDTVARHIMMSEVLLKRVYDDRGLPRPVASNEEWYIRLGYEVFARDKKGIKHKHPDGDIPLEIVFLKKTLR